MGEKLPQLLLLLLECNCVRTELRQQGEQTSEIKMAGCETATYQKLKRKAKPDGMGIFLVM
jgi:hypothetical protein